VTARRAGERLARPAASGDAGYTMVELIVVLALMGVLTAIFTGAILQIYRTVNRTDALATAQNHLNISFARLDKQVRYGEWIRPEIEVGQYRYVEFLGTEINSQKKCNRLVLDTSDGRLRHQVWTPGTSPATGSVLASDVVVDAGGPPVFDVQQPGSEPYVGATPGGAGSSFKPDYQRLRIRLSTEVGLADKAATAAVDVTFTAVNTTRETPDNIPATVCTEGRP
jgi:prepilin-type N-terminal cleavage/methylation domain-containing protein